MTFSINLPFLYPDASLETALSRAHRAGFTSVEIAAPYEHAASLAVLLARYGLELDLFNLPMGDFAGGERGFASDPTRKAEFVLGVESARRIAVDVGCRKVNALAGNRIRSMPLRAQLDCLASNLTWAADVLGREGITVVTELLNPHDHVGYLHASIDISEWLMQATGGAGVKLQLDTYHLARIDVDVIEAIEHLGKWAAHYQLGDMPHRTEPGSGVLDFPRILEAIFASYSGKVGLEYYASRPSVDPFTWIEAYGYKRAD